MTVEEYIGAVTPAQKKEFQRIRSIVMELVPEAEEVISYDIPTWKYQGKYVLYFAAYKTHMSLHPVSMTLINELANELGDFVVNEATKKSAGTVQFTEDNPVPDVLVRAVIVKRLEEIEGRR